MSTTDTPETDKAAKKLNMEKDGYDLIQARVSRRIERERDEARAEVERWKYHFITFAVIHMASYGKEHFGNGYMHPQHYDLLKEAGARMDDFKRAESNPPIMP